MTQKPVFPKPRFYLVLALLAAVGFGFTAVCGVWGVPRPPWGNIALSAVPMTVFFLFWHLSRRGHWSGIPALAVTIALFVLFLAGDFFNLLLIGLDAMGQPRDPTLKNDAHTVCIVEKGLALDLDGAKVLLAEDTHGGFHGDGETRIILALNDAPSAVESIVSQWPAFPADETLNTIFFEHSGLGEDFFFPQVQQGHYSFRDRYAEQYPNDTRPLLQRSSYNYTAALYDTENSTLYYYELDT